MPKKSHQKRGRLGWMSILTALLLLVTAAGCTPPLDDIGKYPAPPATQKLATLMAMGIATAVPEYPGPEYPAPIPGPLRGPDPTPTPTVTPTSDPFPKAVQASKYYLAGWLERTPEEVLLISWKPSVWVDAGLGCSSAPSVSSQTSQSSQIKGYRIFSMAAGTQYELHSSEDGGNICITEMLLPGERLPLEAGSTAQQSAQMARLHLSNRLGFSLDQISIEALQSIEWSEDDPNCQMLSKALPTQSTPQKIVGQRILLMVEKTLYEYRSGGSWLVYCGNPSS